MIAVRCDRLSRTLISGVIRILAASPLSVRPISSRATSVYESVNPAITKLAPRVGYLVKSFITINLPDGITSANPLPITVTVVLRVR